MPWTHNPFSKSLDYYEKPAASDSEFSVSRTVNLISNLRALLLESNRENEIISVLGYNAINDGGGGLFRYVHDASLSDDNGMVFSSPTADYFYKRIYEEGAINVKWFGATGDGVTDDTTALGNSFDYLIENGDAGTIYIPKGNFLVTQTITLGKANNVNGITIEGAGVFFEGGFPNLSKITFNPSVPESNLFDIPRHVQHTTIRNLSIYTAYTNVNTKHGISISERGLNIILENLRIDGFQQGAAIHITHCFNSMIRRNYIKRSYDGILLEAEEALDYFSTMEVSHNWIRSYSRYGIALMGTTGLVVNSIVNNNIFELVNDEEPYSTVTDTDLAAIYLTNTISMEVSGNHFEHLHRAPTSTYDSSGIVLNGSTVRSTKIINNYFSVEIDDYQIKITSSVDTHISNNRFHTAVDLSVSDTGLSTFYDFQYLPGDLSALSSASNTNGFVYPSTSTDTTTFIGDNLDLSLGVLKGMSFFGPNEISEIISGTTISPDTYVVRMNYSVATEIDGFPAAWVADVPDGSIIVMYFSNSNVTLRDQSGNVLSNFKLQGSINWNPKEYDSITLLKLDDVGKPWLEINRLVF